MRVLLLPVLLLLAACNPTDTSAPGDTPERIVTLAPHLAELVVLAGAGERIVGVSAYTNYPPSVAGLPVIGDAFMLDQEQLALLHPDLLLAWESGTPGHVVDELRERGYRVELVRTQDLDDVGTALRRIGELAGTTAAAAAAAEDYAERLATLRGRWAAAEPIRVFYQVDQRPLYTVGGDHYVSELIELCGGENIFAELSALAPMVSEEAVVDRDPELLLAAGDAGDDVFGEWLRWPTLAANRYGNHYRVPADIIGRATPRLLEAAAAVCDRLQQGRASRAGRP